MYESPIHLYLTDIQTQLIQKQEEQILKAVQSVAVDVDHDELFRALKYDRDQYMKGYRDGVADAKPKWIAVSERLPEPFALVLTYDSTATMVADSYLTRHHEWVGVRMNHKVTHWMPIPELPKEE